MSLIIPYKFKGGTSAKAQEVNANFEQVRTFCNNLETAVASDELSIAELQNGKANINGDMQQLFKVATPNNTSTDNDKAVNVRYVNDNVISVLKYGIFGLKMYISGENSIAMAPGACYDSTYQYPIVSPISTNTTFSVGITASTTYDIYIVMRLSTNSPYLELCVENSTPSLVYDDIVYRKLGKVSTDADTHLINLVEG